jgi:glyoxylase-like metal-dependent hydrolase (beta-lactamase superfamily II)
MLRQITDGVWIHESNFLRSNAIIVQGTAGVLMIDPGITSAELAGLAKDIQELGQSVVAGYSTHPHWDHLLWHADFGEAPRYGTTRGETEIHNFLSNADWKTQVAPMLPPDIADQIPMDDLFGRINGLPAGTTQLPWDGPTVRIIEHQGHAAGSAALLIEEYGVLVAGDMLSDILVPFLELDAENPTADYLAALDLFAGLADDVKIFIPGHGSVGDADELRARIKLDRAYVEALRGGGGSDDPRLTTGPQKDLLASVHEWQVRQIAQKREHEGMSGE